MTRFSSSYWRDIGWQASGNTLAQLVGVAGIPLLTRLYAPADFAAQSLFIQVVTVCTAVVTWRYEYFVQLPKSDDEAKSLNGLVMLAGLLALLVMTPILWLLQEPLARQLGNPELASWLVLAPLTAVLVSWGIAAQNNAQRHRDFKNSGLGELVGKLAYVGTGVLGALVHLGSLGLILTTALGALVKTGFVFMRRSAWRVRPVSFDLRGVHTARRQYGRLATSTVAAHLLSTSAVAVPQVALGHLYGADVLGQFALVLATIYLPSGLLGAAVGQVYYQRAAASWADQEPFHGLWKETLNKLLLIGVPIYGLIALLSPWIYPFVFGPQWQLAGVFAAIMSVAAFGSFITSPMDRSCLIVGAWRYSIAWSIFRLVSSVVVTWMASRMQWSPLEFVTVLATQMCSAYAIDLAMSRRFSLGLHNASTLS
jgi:teichuronic acid exporter